jgi:HK97 family phage major capsid protein
MPFSSELGNQLASLREQFVTATAVDKPTAEDVEKAQKMHIDLAAIEKQYSAARELELASEQAKTAIEGEKKRAEEVINTVPFNGKNGDGGSFSKTISSSDVQKMLAQMKPRSVIDNFLESGEYLAKVKGKHWHGITYSIEVPGTIKAAGDPIMSSHFAPRTTDQTVPPHYAAMPTVYDLFRVVPVSGTASVRFYQATMPLTNNAAFIAEGAAKPEVQPRWAPVDAPIETVAEWTAVTLQALDDVPSLRAVLEDDLRRLLLLKIDEKLLTGTGTPPEIRGVLNTSGILTQAFATDALNSISLGITQIVAGGSGYPTGIVMNPTNWQTTRMLNTNGVWYFGSPADAGVSRLFGIPVITSPSMTAGFALVGDFTFGTIFERWGVTFIVGLKNDDIIKNLQTIVCEARLALAIRRPTAFCNVDVVTP